MIHLGLHKYVIIKKTTNLLGKKRRGKVEQPKLQPAFMEDASMIRE